MSTSSSEPNQHLGLADRRDRLDGEQVHAGRDECLDPGPVEVGQGRRPRVVVAAVLGPVGEHRAVRPDRAGDEQFGDGQAGLVGVPVASAPGEIDARPDGGQRSGTVQPGRREARRSSPGSWPSSRPGRRPGSSRDGRPRWRPGRSSAGAPTRAGRTGRSRAPRARWRARRRGRRPRRSHVAISSSGRGSPAPA